MSIGSQVPLPHDAICLQLPLSQMNPMPHPAASPQTPPQPSSPQVLPVQSGMQHFASVHFSPMWHGQSLGHDSQVSPWSHIPLPQNACFRHLPDWHFSPEGHAPHWSVSPQPLGAEPQSSTCPTVLVASLAQRRAGMQFGSGWVMPIMTSPPVGLLLDVPVDVPSAWSVVDANCWPAQPEAAATPAARVRNNA
jgi:hypothetical protein